MRRQRIAATVALVAIALFPAKALAQRAVTDPLTLFAKMMPVLSHDRCVNCHGATNPYTGEYHPGAVRQDADCSGCHTAKLKSGFWRLAPPPFAFFQKTTRQLCNHFEILGANESTALHLEHDELIGLAFIGRRGNAVDRTFAQPPPMTRAEFVRAFRTWARDGGGACSGWEGTITRTETIATDTTPGSGPNPPAVYRMNGLETAIMQSGTHTYTIKIKNGIATVSTTHTGESLMRSIGRQDGCTSTTYVRDAYSLVSTTPPSDEAGDGPLVATGDGSVRVGIAADGSYRIHVVPPREKTQITATTRNINDCGVNLPTFPASTETFDWPEWIFEIVGKLSDPKNRRRIAGQSTIDVDSSYNPSFGLAYHAAVSGLDGKPFKFRITMTWDLSRVP